MKLDTRLVDTIYTQLYDYYMLLVSQGRDIPLDLHHAMQRLEEKYGRAADREAYRQRKGYR